MIRVTTRQRNLPMGALASNEPTINEKKKYEISLQNGLPFRIRIRNSLDGDGDCG